MPLEKRSYVNSEFEAQKTLLSTFVLIRVKRDEREGKWAGKMLLLFCGSVRGEKDGEELAFLR